MRYRPLTREERAVLNSALVTLTARLPAWNWRRPRREIVGALVSEDPTGKLPTMLAYLYVRPPRTPLHYWSCGVESGVTSVDAPTLDALMAKMTTALPTMFQQLADSVRGAV